MYLLHYNIHMVPFPFEMYCRLSELKWKLQISNPVMAEADKHLEGELRKTHKFTEQLRAEQETFKAVLARRRQRISAVDEDEED